MHSYENIKIGLNDSNGIKICAGTQDFQEGINSFLEKRKPVFKGE